MARIRPHTGIRPADPLAARVISPPYDVLSETEARALCADNPFSFLHVTRPEVNLPAGTDAHSDAAYVAAREALARLQAMGALVRDPRPSVYLYGQKMPMKDGSGAVVRWHEQVGFLTCVSVEEYDRGLIRKHEHTRPDKVEDRSRLIEILGAQTGLVFLAWREDAALTALLDRLASGTPAWSVPTEDGVIHTLWVVSEPDRIRQIEEAFAQVPILYVADGHHRSQAASLCHARHPEGIEHAWFLAGVFPATRLQVLAYNRLVADLNGLDVPAFLEAVEERFAVHPDPDPVPSRRGLITMYVEGRWYGLTPHAERVPADPVGRLDVSVLQDQLLAPVLGIRDPRRDGRIEFVGGIRGWRELKHAVDERRAAVAFHLFPTGLEQLMDVADSGQVMPPKSTWFEPKLRGGVVVHALD
ncbi:MAG: DUF1015 domain-containing protein [Deltaproteobacteria bacterium]|nr:DUF1015 domain-containing protein [Deltaproteobacteria bacterium]